MCTLGGSGHFEWEGDVVLVHEHKPGDPRPMPSLK